MGGGSKTVVTIHLGGPLISWPGRQLGLLGLEQKLGLKKSWGWQLDLGFTAWECQNSQLILA